MSITLKDIKKAIHEADETWDQTLPLKSLEFRKAGRIRDPIYGYHTLKEIDFLILDLPPLQRLRYISQLGFVNKIYPGANHTRFEHSIGVAAVAERIMKALKEKHSRIQPVINITEDDIRLAKIAGYLHDIGHVPFSHASEQIFEALQVGKNISKELQLGEDYDPHELFSYLMIRTKYITKILENISRKFKIELDSSMISDAVLGRLKEGKRYISDIIHGATDSDRIDYLLRDGYYTGVPHGHVDIEHLAKSFCLIEREKSIWLGIDERGLEAVEALYSSRDVMYPTVYLHHTCRIAEGMLSRALYYAHRDGKLDIEELLMLNDAQLLAKLKDIGYHTLVNQILYRKFHKRIFVFKSRDIEYKGTPVDRLIIKGDPSIRELATQLNDFFSSWQKTLELEEEILSDLNSYKLREGMILIDAPRHLLERPKSEADLELEEYLPVRLRQGETEPIWKLSPIVKGIETLSHSLRPSVIVAVDRSIRGKVLEQIRKVFKKKFEERFQFRLRTSAVFKRNT